MVHTYLFYDGSAAYCSRCHKAIGVDDYMLARHIESCGYGRDYSLSYGDNGHKIKVWRAGRSTTPYQDVNEKDYCGRFIFLKDEIRFRVYTVKWHDGETIRSIAGNSVVSYCYECRFRKDRTLIETRPGYIDRCFERLDKGELFLSGTKDAFVHFQKLYGGCLTYMTYTDLLAGIRSGKFVAGDYPSIAAVSRLTGIKGEAEKVIHDPTGVGVVVDTLTDGGKDYIRMTYKFYSKTRYVLTDGRRFIGYGLLDSIEDLIGKEKRVYIDHVKLAKYTKEHPAAMLDRYDGRFPLLPILGPYLLPMYELLYKAGFSHLADEAVINKTWKSCDTAKTSLPEIYGLPMNVLGRVNDALGKELFVLNHCLDAMRSIQTHCRQLLEVEEYNHNYRVVISEHIRFRRGICFCDLIDREDDPKSILKLLRYVSSHDWGGNFHEYLDYLHMRKTVGRLDYPVCTTDFMHLHNRLVREFRQVMDKKMAEDFRRVVSDKKNTYYETGDSEVFKDDSYVVICPKELDDLRDESAQMCNCVKTYAQKVIDRNCIIVFIRKAKAVRESYVTVEISKHKAVVQAKAKFNRRIPDKAEEFLKKWAANKGLKIISY